MQPDPRTDMPADDARPDLTAHDYLTAAADAVSRAAADGPVAVDPDVADFMGAFEDDALSETEALDSIVDWLADGEEGADHG